MEPADPLDQSPINVTAGEAPLDLTPHLPQPTIWPAVVGLGITTALAGIVLTPAIVAIGGLVLAIGLAGWIAELRHAPD